MPPSPSSQGARFIPNLSQIIGLEPDNEPWCAGYAYAQRRRCHARTHGYDRIRARCLLDKGIEELRAGMKIDDILEELAPHVLCTQNHQSQASDLAQRWKDEVQLFIQIQAQSRSPRETATETEDELDRAPVMESGPIERATEIDIPSESRNLSTDILRERIHSLFDSLHAYFQIAGRKILPARSRKVRRPVQGPCIICLESLNKPCNSEKDDEFYFSGDSDSDTYMKVVEQRKSLLTYCKSNCGNNFHFTCLQEWLGHAEEPTCPICRTIWTN
ncbi:hypothetical protein N7493_006309 [Penicillium malachiteum]|uniref:RING-type domain-containing protein n=1 Tax=Penicillium malachiteum TaxID=1324776 RepID=A0AAD6HKD9_9EURO|nr:hypothetical protein N7493_006309 [Penicillium malachiteum]